MPDTTSASVDDTPKVRKTKGFKRIRGFLSGESRKERKERRSKAKELQKSKTSNKNDPKRGAEVADDASTIYNVDVDERSVLTSGSSSKLGGAASAASAPPSTKAADATKKSVSSSSKAKPYMLRVVMLLMDPTSRRFELLQLEFDSLKALVSDVLAQIPVSVTEESLRKQVYTGICGKDGKEMAPTKLLADFCKGNDVLVAVPEGMPAKDCARLAKPIICDDKVVQMLQSSGIDAKAWREKSSKKKKKSKSKSGSEDNGDESSTTPGAMAETTLIFTVMVLLAILLQVFHLYISAPIKPGHVVSPGVWLNKCGVMSLLPTCDNSYVTFTDAGVITMYNADKDMVWQMEGAVCPEGDDDCIPGMQVKDDSSLIVGGKPVYYVKTYTDDAALSPWPFAETPKVRMIRK